MHKSERIVRCYLEAAGWNAKRNGWPDFTAYCHKRRRWIVVEVKNTGRIGSHQRETMRLLIQMGAEAYVISNGVLGQMDKDGVIRRTPWDRLGLSSSMRVGIPEWERPRSTSRGRPRGSKSKNTPDPKLVRRDKRIVAMVRRGHQQTEVAKRFRVSKQRIHQIMCKATNDAVRVCRQKTSQA